MNPSGAVETLVAREAKSACLGRLELSQFRNFAELQCEFPPDGVAIIGPNGSGKTNLLEAVYYLEIFRSFRGSRDAELVRFGEDVFRIEATIAFGGDDLRLAAAYQRRGNRKKVEVNGLAAGSMSEAVGRFGAVVFSLADVEIVRGAPEFRRRFLDIALSLAAPGYLDALRRYRAVLAQRNEALRRLDAQGVVDAWSERLIEAGSEIMAARERWVATWAAPFDGYYRTISGAAGSRLRYRPSVEAPAPGPVAGEEAPEPEDPVPPETRVAAWAERFGMDLAVSAERERRRGLTVVGPHRDDLQLMSPPAEADGHEIRHYGSGGQQRTAAIALRLVEADSLWARQSREPLYLLDDVLAELDDARSERVVELLEEGRSGQVIFTAPKRPDLPLRGGRLAEWTIRDGVLNP